MTRWAPLCLTLLAALVCAAQQQAPPEGIEYFEKHVRPVLAGRCYACHGPQAKMAMGGLRVDSRAALLKGGDSGPAVTPGDPDRSLLWKAVHYGDLKLKMPPQGKLPEAELTALREWIRMGAPDPRVEPAAPGPAPAKPSVDWTAARKFWAFQPVRDVQPPAVQNRSWAANPIDRFLMARLEEKRLAPAPPADRATLLRRVTFDLTGLPPSAADLEAFLNDQTPDAWRRVVDRLLASPHYGERWARHWLDLVRYVETNGHEYDNDKADPWRYRDYVIRAFNDDLPYDQFVREHVAGDLLPRPRLGKEVWESPLATGFFWFGEVLNSAVDSVKSRADEVDNQLDVMGKAFLGLTVACARCHDHKFDPIPTRDYYSLAGILHSTELREAVLDSPETVERIQRARQRLAALVKQSVPSRPSSPPHAPEHKLGQGDILFEDFSRPGYPGWYVAGQAFGDTPRSELPFHQPLRNFAGDSVASSFGEGTDRLAGSLTSLKFRMPRRYVHVRLAGTKAAKDLKERNPLRLSTVCDGYKGQHFTSDGGDRFQWKTARMTLEFERLCYIEIVDRARDGHIVIDKIVFSDSKEPPRDADVPDRTFTYDSTFAAALADIERDIPESSFAMISADWEPRDVRVHIRGNHQNLGEPAPRGFLRVIAGDSQEPVRSGSGRRELAEWIASAKNPLTARVMVNRVWKHHFGYGLVRTPDNFGQTGERPTHPELLDWLAARFVESGWSVKSLHRLILLSSAYSLSSRPQEQAKALDPENKLLHHMPVRRLEGEAIRDAMLAVAGNLDGRLYGPSVPPHISAYQDGRGKPASGPLDGNRRRSIYIQLRRNFLPPMFLAFDFPLPTSAIGQRTVSTVPSQALLLLNNEFVMQQAKAWAERAAGQWAEPEARARGMYLQAFGRVPDDAELKSIVDFVRTNPGAWSDVAHVLWNTPEFVYLR